MRVWGAGGQELHAWAAHDGQVYAVAFSPDGQTLAAGCGDEAVRLWDVASGKNTATLRGHSGVGSLIAMTTALISLYWPLDRWLANRVYSGVPADDFGYEQRIAVGPMSGKSNVVWWLERHGFRREPEQQCVDTDQAERL